jgi:hypothetical protein
MLKLLAALFMLLDHVGYYFYDLLPESIILIFRSVGRLAFPIFAWLIARGYERTQNSFHYFIRISIFAVVSEVIIRAGHALIGWPMSWTNVLVTFSLSLFAIAGYRLAYHSFLDMIASLRPISPTSNTLPTYSKYDVRVNPGIRMDPRIGLPLGSLMIALAVGGALWLKPDYGVFGLVSVLLFYIVMSRFPDEQQQRRCFQGFVLLHIVFIPIRIFVENWPIDWVLLQILSLFSIPICFALDRNRRPSRILKYFFYVFYPLHLLLLCLIRYAIDTSFLGP